MRELTTEEMKQVSGGGAFSFLVNAGLTLASATFGFFAAGPVGAAVSVGAFWVGTGAGALYDVSNEGREDQRVENYDAYGNRM
jgi:bacteriocin-like protein